MAVCAAAAARIQALSSAAALLGVLAEALVN